MIAERVFVFRTPDGARVLIRAGSKKWARDKLRWYCVADIDTWACLGSFLAGPPATYNSGVLHITATHRYRIWYRQANPREVALDSDGQRWEVEWYRGEPYVTARSVARDVALSAVGAPS